MAEGLSDVSGMHIEGSGHYRLRCRLPPVLAPGAFVVDVWLGTQYEDCDMREQVVSFTVEGALQGRPDRLVKLGLPWSVEQL